ncbi:MAG TPA: hypothetical protein VMF09_17095 [Solirubrobacteraceae bacterium]|nr:hypothetical protein [Solirubrobacteraceae bacterium]
MKRITMLAMAMLGVLVIGGAGAGSVSAQSHEFIANKTGKTKSAGTTAQIFKTGSGTVECTTVTGTGEIAAGKTTTHKEVLTFSGCTGFGGKATVSAAHFEYNANGPAKLEKEVTIKPEGLSCEMVIEPQTVESLSYENDSGKLKSAASISKIKAKGTGGVCGGSTEATYGGTIVGELEGGTLEWK